MSAYSDVDEFIELSRRAPTMAALQNLLEAAAHGMGFDFYALVQHVDVRRSSNREIIWLENYPDSWAEAFVAQGLYANDPILVASQKTSIGFQWSEVERLISLTPHHKRVLAQAAREGMGDGFTVPAHVPGDSNGTCSFAVRVGRELPRQNLMMAQLIGLFAFEGARRIVRQKGLENPVVPKLTPRQLDCLLHVARGKSDWEIAQILNIKEHTVRDYIEDACQRYGVRRRIQLTMRAIHDGQLLLLDTIG
ncbi:MAG TPA: LuxR family transcriptional regulator [Sphingobium sp.]|uniref:helix-turn-helix transcriptional regulator n=1 Tax=Sphingobium sp. TaxID=1912891 RepID=UPI002ED59EE6